MTPEEQYIEELLDIAANGHASYGLGRELTPDEFKKYNIRRGYGLSDPDADEDSGKYLPVSLETIETALETIKAAKPVGETETTVKHLSQKERELILEGLRTYGDTGVGWDDAGLCTAVAEIGMFGQVVFG